YPSGPIDLNGDVLFIGDDRGIHHQDVWRIPSDRTAPAVLVADYLYDTAPPAPTREVHRARRRLTSTLRLRADGSGHRAGRRSPAPVIRMRLRDRHRVPAGWRAP